ncbi:hypothetical protein EV122DRAFT_278590 [Schizophyllum commune]
MLRIGATPLRIGAVRMGTPRTLHGAQQFLDSARHIPALFSTASCRLIARVDFDCKAYLERHTTILHAMQFFRGSLILAIALVLPAVTASPVAVGVRRELKPVKVGGESRPAVRDEFLGERQAGSSDW